VGDSLGLDLEDRDLVQQSTGWPVAVMRPAASQLISSLARTVQAHGLINGGDQAALVAVVVRGCALAQS
jgi:hypothetical protein